MKKFKFSKIEHIIKDARRGRMFVLLDDESRENEGDLVNIEFDIIGKYIKKYIK